MKTWTIYEVQFRDAGTFSGTIMGLPVDVLDPTCARVAAHGNGTGFEQAANADAAIVSYTVINTVEVGDNECPL